MLVRSDDSTTVSCVNRLTAMHISGADNVTGCVATGICHTMGLFVLCASPGLTASLDDKVR